ncbi:hypothetical protein C0J52_07633 [Blattella germanica]|nr:hypothetical protein C0J52_07633 [Blattella germanica]
MSGQWEVVGKSKQKQNGQSKKMSKNERKKFVENAPKVEDILPLAQVKTLYTALDNNKENRKPSGKENSAKENESKKAQKKQQQQPEKKKEVKEKPPTPKSLETAVKMLDHTNPVTNHKAYDYPLCALSGDIRDVLKQALKDAGDTPVQHFFHICLSAMANDMSRGPSSVYGYKVMLQLMAFQNPSITINNIPKVTSLRNSYQNRQPIGLAILWAVGQGGMKDIRIGLKVMVPLLEMRNYTAFVITYLKDILNQSPENKPISQEQFFAVLDVIHSSNNLPNNLKQELLGLSSTLRTRALKTEPEKHSKNFFEPLLQRLQPTASKVLREELLASLVTCLNCDQHCYSIWRQMYTKHLPQSAHLLGYIDSQWSKLKGKMTHKMFKETLSTFRVTNEELKKGKQKGDQNLLSCQHSCESIRKYFCVIMPPDQCGLCQDSIKSAEESIDCIGPCEKHYHLTCAKIDVDEKEFFVIDGISRYKCHTCTRRDHDEVFVTPVPKHKPVKLEKTILPSTQVECSPLGLEQLVEMFGSVKDNSDYPMVLLKEFVTELSHLSSEIKLLRKEHEELKSLIEQRQDHSPLMPNQEVVETNPFQSFENGAGEPSLCSQSDVSGEDVIFKVIHKSITQRSENQSAESELNGDSTSQKIFKFEARINSKFPSFKPRNEMNSIPMNKFPPNSDKELIKKMTVSRSFPWKFGSFLLLMAICALLSYDIQKHGSFRFGQRKMCRSITR